VLPAPAHSPLTPVGSDRFGAVSTLASLLPLFAEADAAEEGQKVITAMLITGLVFVAVIALGELTRYLFHRRR
jgi:hypothetical protein